MVGTGSVDCAGAITATLTWQGTEPRPKCVILKETATAYWRGASGGCNPGLMGGTVSAYDDSEGGHSKSAVKYSVVDTSGGNPPDLSVSPTANASQPTDPGSAAANVSYQVDPTEVSIAFTGATTIGNAPHYLVGQGMGATLSVTGFTPFGYTWTVTGGEPFKEWKRTDMSSTGANETLDTTLATLKGYFRKADPVTVICAATVTTPSGDLAVTAEGKVAVDAPAISDFTSVLGEVAVTYQQRPDGTVDTTPQFGLYPKQPPPPQPEPGGMTWKARVKLPSGYTGTGKFYFLNVCSVPSRKYTVVETGASVPLNINNIRCLDHDEKYDNQEFDTGDALSPGVGDNPGDGTTTQYKKVTVTNEQFETYLMFTPPGTDSQPVSLKCITWSWTGELTWLPTIPYPNNYSLTSEGQAAGTAIVWTKHPTWANNTKNQSH